MNILITTSKGLGYGGAEISLSQYAAELGCRGHKVIIVSSQDYSKVTTEKMRFVEKLPFSIQTLYLKRLFRFLIKKHSIQIINPQDNVTTLPAILAAKECNISSVAHVRDLWFACPKSVCLKPDYSDCINCNSKDLRTCSNGTRYFIDFYKFIYLKRNLSILELADLKICASTSVRNRLIQCGIKRNIQVLPIARELGLFENVMGVSEFKEKYRLREVVVSFIGSFFYTKGILQLFKFMPEILRKHSNVSLLLVGDGPLKDFILKLIKIENLEDQIILTGRLSYDKIPLCYAASDLILAPHIWYEPFGATILEASAASKPFIVSDRGGPSDFKDKFNYILPPNDILQWKEKVIYLINNPRFRKELGDKAKIEAAKMSVKNYIDQIEQLYKPLLK